VIPAAALFAPLPALWQGAVLVRGRDRLSGLEARDGIHEPKGHHLPPPIDFRKAHGQNRISAPHSGRVDKEEGFTNAKPRHQIGNANSPPAAVGAIIFLPYGAGC